MIATPFNFFPPALAAFAALCLGSAARAQQVFVVDAAGGPGHDFRRIGDAVDKASHGDRILVRAGVYKPLDVAKGVTIAGEPGVIISQPTNRTGSRIHDVPAGRVCTLQGLFFHTEEPAITVFSAVNCAGRVVFDRLQFDDYFSAPGQGIYISAVAGLTIDRCAIPRLVRISDSNVLAVGTAFLSAFPFLNEAPVEAWRSRLTLVQCTAQAAGQFLAPAVRCHASYLELRGDSSSRLIGAPSRQASSILGDTQSEVVWDPRITFSPLIQRQFGKVSWRQMPFVTLDGGRLGGTVRVRISARQGHAYWLYVSLPGPRVPLPGFGDVWIDAGAFFLGASGVQGAGDTFVSRTIPNAPSLRGFGLGYQAITGIGASLELTNAATVTLTTR